MLLDTITSPDDLRTLRDDELQQLAAEIRDFIVDSVTRTGGHIGSNLGVVELTIALHRVFHSPEDIILWDTGHQAYVHKLLTGRKDGFESLRQPDGLSGYPSREESAHDWVENSHASTVLSYAHGIATGQESALGDGRRVIAVVGDGAMTGGMAFEGLNNLGHSGRRVVIVLNDNGRSYAPTVSRLGESLKQLRLDPRYRRNQARIEELLGRVPKIGERLERGFDATKAAVREFWEPRAFFEDLGVAYVGPFDGHDMERLERALLQAADIDGPIVVHVLTEKGRGYAKAENDPIKKLHDTSVAKPGSYTEAFSEALIKEGEARPELVAITAAMPDSTGLLPFDERFPGRCFDVGIAEQHAVTSAAGMAMSGLRPVIAVYSTFLSRAFDQVNLDVGLHGQPVVFCLDRAGITGDDGASHHGVLDMVLFSKIPNMTVFAPSSYQELQVMLHDALDLTEGPSLIRWPKTAARNVGDDEVGSGLAARRARAGSDVAILAVGKMLEAAETAADELATQGIDATVWDVRVVKPLDPAMIADAAAHPVVVTVEDGLRDGGAGTAIADAITERCFGRVAPPVRVLGVPTAYIPHGKADAILAELGLDADGIAAEAARWVRARDTSDTSALHADPVISR
ncbi:MAG: 1-deoxy-D-xylulose-5-phosphate synthase [Actinomycetota bacterium]|nr:1-deoxy-D-xylulose-5-phosphate synthase [Actinomycetota bacterium]